jgi:CrcB protein
VLKITLIATGGAAGSLLRYWLGMRVQGGAAFPYGTLVVNVSGCLAIGFLAAVLAGPGVREEYRLAILVGVLGGYTTYSSFGLETYRLATGGQAGMAAAYVLLTNVLAIGAVWAGAKTAALVRGA